MEEDGIEWDRVTDNLKIFKVDEENLIELGNPFQPDRSYAPEIKKVYVKAPLPKWYVALLIVFILLTGVFFVKSLTDNSIARILEAEEIKYVLELEYSPEGELLQYYLRVNIEKEYLKESFGVPFSLHRSRDGIMIENNSSHTLRISQLHHSGSIQPGEGYLIMRASDEVIEIEIVDVETDITYRIIVHRGDILGERNQEDSDELPRTAGDI